MGTRHLKSLHTHTHVVAILGASDNPDKIGGRPIRFMRDFGYEGAIYPVNPGREVVQGLTCYASLSDLPEAAEAVIVAVAGANVVAAVEECARLGVKLCVIMASGFGETGPEGKAIEAGMALLGPLGGAARQQQLTLATL